MITMLGIGIVDGSDRLHVGRGSTTAENRVERIATMLRRGIFASCPQPAVAQLQAADGEGIDQQAALACEITPPRAGSPLGRSARNEDVRVVSMTRLSFRAPGTHAFAGRDRVQRLLDRAGERAGMRHRGGAAAFGSASSQRVMNSSCGQALAEHFVFRMPSSRRPR